MDANKLKETREMINVIEEEKHKYRKKVKGIAKTITLSMMVIAFLVGLVGSFKQIPLDMKDFTMFLGSFAPFYMILIVSIGANSVVEKVKKEDKK